jgi:hypothetical protein
MRDLSTELFIARDRAVARLSELHDDYFHTNQLWLKLLADQRHGQSFEADNVKTGVITASQSEWVGRARASQQRLRIRTFKDLTNQFEMFLGDLLRIWLTQYPESVQAKSITLATLLSASDLATAKKLATEEAVEATILKILLGKPSNWFAYLKSNLGSKLPASDSSAFIERKAVRDALEHHDGEIDASYIEKAGAAIVFKVGDLVVPDDAAIDQLYDLVVRLIVKVAADAEQWSKQL